MRIAFLTNDLLSSNPQNMWKGVIDVARAHDSDSLCLVGGYINESSEALVQANVLYDTINAKNIDGVVIRGHLCSRVSPELEMRFYQDFSPLPCVVIGRQAKGIPHLILDSYSGMRDAIIHLIEAHGFQRIAFVRGPELYDAEERYRAYLDVLSEYHIPFDPNLVTSALNNWNSDINSSVQQLLNRNSHSLDAIVTASDGLAQYLIEELKKHHIHIPEDIAVVGFDNSGTVITPRLTSVDGVFYEQGKRGAEMLFDLLDGQAVPERILLPTRLHIRQSCGCLDREVVRASTSPQRSLNRVVMLNTDSQNKQQLHVKIENLKQRLQEPWNVDLLQALIDQIKGTSSDHFLRVLDSTLRVSVVNSIDLLDTWHNRISALREQVLCCIDHQSDVEWIEDLFQQARVLVSQALLWEQSKRRKDAQQRTNLLYEISQTLVTTFDTPELMEVLARELPRLGIPSAYISLYEQSLSRLRLLLAYNHTGRSDQPQQTFPSWQFIPDHLLPVDHPYSLVVEVLYFQDEIMGLLALEVGPREGSVYDMLRGQISSALKGAQLFIQNTQLYEEAKHAQKNAEEADRLKSRFLASVSHELRTPLNMLIGLSEMLLKEQGSNRPPLPTLYRQDLDRIHTSAHHLDDLLRDVLDLAHSQMGRLKLVSKPIDLGEVLESVSALVEPIIHQKGLTWKTKIPDGLLPVWADAARIKQVLLNLIHNAIKFTIEGEIALSATLGNSEVTISISDTGLGIPIEEQDLIFDEFHTNQRVATRGYGGTGLGLAICRKLVEMHNGRISVSSTGNAGKGSTFYFTLPTMSHYPEPIPVLVRDTPYKQTVLLISDHGQPNHRLEDHLMQEGFTIQTLQVKANIPGNLPIMFEIPPQMIILDIEIGSPQSQNFIHLVKGHHDLKDVPILFYSLFYEQNSGSVFMLDHVAKPVDTSTLLRALARYGLDDQPQSSILIVDDDRSTLDMNSRIVQSQLPTCHILEANNGREALNLIYQHQPDLVLLDLMMPELDGFDVLMAMQSDEAIRHIPAIVLTAMTLTEEDMARMSQGATAILSKGVFSADETLTHIKNILARNHHLGSESQRVVRKVMAYIHQNFVDPISRVDMADYADVSERHLDRCFQQDMGITPIAYLNRYRVKQAKTLLIETARTVTEIALDVGFSNSSHFSRVFRREVGSSPSIYRKHT